MVSTAPLYRPIVLAIALTEALTARQVSEVVMRELLPAFGGGRLAIYLLHEDRHLYLAWEHGFPSGFLRPFEGVALDARLPGVETLTSGRPLFFESMHKLAALYPGIPLDATEGARAFLPLIASGRPVGSCILGFDRERGFSDEERTVLTALAGLIAQALERARRYESEAALAADSRKPCCRTGCPPIRGWRRRAAICRAPRAWTWAATGTTWSTRARASRWSSATSRGTGCRPPRRWANCAARSVRSRSVTIRPVR